MCILLPLSNRRTVSLQGLSASVLLVVRGLLAGSDFPVLATFRAHILWEKPAISAIIQVARQPSILPLVPAGVTPESPSLVHSVLSVVTCGVTLDR